MQHKSFFFNITKTLNMFAGIWLQNDNRSWAVYSYFSVVYEKKKKN